MPELQGAELKKKIKREASRLGMNLIGFANVGRWEEAGEVNRAYWPQTIWPWSQTVIVMAVQIYLPMLATTPSVVYSELYNTTNRYLDEAAYRVANVLNELGYRAHFFPRDCYGDISVLVKKPEAAFSHVFAGKYAGLGTIGMNHTLLTPKYGPRIRLVSVITDAKVRADPMLEKELCIHCRRCVSACPTRAFTPIPKETIARMDKHRCALYHQQLKNDFRYPCGVCTAVCPVGEDWKKYKGEAVSREGIAHCQDFGSKNAVRKLERAERQKAARAGHESM